MLRFQNENCRILSLVVCGLCLLTICACSNGILPQGKKSKASKNPSVQETPPADVKKAHDATTAEKLANTAQRVLKKYCISCHGETTSAQGGIEDVTNLDSLVTKGLVRPGVPDDSTLFQAMTAKTMPPSDPKPTDEEMDSIRQWILSLAQKEDRSPLKLKSVILAVTHDLLSVEKSERRFYRYLDATHLYNAGASDLELNILRKSVAKAVNSLSMSKNLVAPVPINLEKTIFRLDLRSYGWTADAWDRLVGQYPYTALLERNELMPILENDTGTTRPLIRADWFIACALRPPSYYRLLGILTDYPGFQEKIGVNFNDDVLAHAVKRAGYQNSAVAAQNRVIERHNAPNGFAWRSYEFSSGIGNQNIFQNPLGPSISNGGPDFLTHAFAEQGGEFIFTLPNGLIGFYVIGANNNRLDFVPSSGKPGIPAKISVGISCMNCHKSGLIDRSDEIRASSINQGLFDESEKAAIQAIYSKRDDFSAAVSTDSKTYRANLAKLGIDYGDVDPIASVNRQFNLPVSFARAAAELWVPLDKIKDKLESLRTSSLSDPRLEIERTRLSDEFGIKLDAPHKDELMRTTFDSAFDQLVKESQGAGG